MIKWARFIFFFFGLLVSGETVAQDFRECQRQFDDLLRLFNQSFAENEPETVRIAEYQRSLRAFQKSYRAYHLAFYNPADSVQKANNEAMLSALLGNYGKAIRLLEAVESTDLPTDYHLGLLHLLNRKYSKALPLLASPRAAKSATLNTLYALAQSGQMRDAIAYGETTAHGNTQGKWNYNLGLLYKKDQQHEAAIGELSSAIRQKDLMAYRLLRGDVLMKIHQPKRAILDFEKAARRHPKAQIRYANALVDLKQFRFAATSFEQYLSTNDRAYRKDALLGLGHAYYGLSQFTEAQRYYRLAATMIKDSPVALCGQANVLVTEHQYEAALTIYNRILKKDSTYVSARIGRGVTRYGLGDYAGALTDMAAAESTFDATDRSLADLFVCRGFARYYLGKAGEALSDFETATRLDGARYEAWAGISGILIDQKNYPQAGRNLSKALQYQKTDDRMWSNYGNLLLHFDMHTKGYDVFKKAVTLNPENLKAQNGWGIVLLEKDKLDQSKTLFDSLIKFNPDVPYLINNRGIANAYVGNRAEQRQETDVADAQYQLAYNDFEAGMQAAPSRRFYNVNQGNVYRYREDYENAKLSYQAYQDKSALNNTGVLYAALDNVKDATYYLETALQMDSAHHVFQFNMNLLTKGTQKEFARDLAKVVASKDGMESQFSDIGIKYSRDGFVTLYLYDYEYDTLRFPGRHFLPLPVAEYDEEYFIPEFDFKLLPYTNKKKPAIKQERPRYKAQRVKMKGSRKRPGTRCPILN